MFKDYSGWKGCTCMEAWDNLKKRDICKKKIKIIINGEKKFREEK